MITKSLWKREWKANINIILLFLALLSLYCGVILAMYDPESGDMLQAMAEQMPELFAAFGMSDAGNTLMEFITNYLYGFILIVIPYMGIVLLTHRLIIRYIDRGSMAYLLASGNSRTKIILTQASFLIFFVCLMCLYVTCFLLFGAVLIHQEQLPLDTLCYLNLGLLGLLLAFSSISFLGAVCFNETKYSLGIATALGIFFLLVQMLSKVGSAMDFLKYMTITTLLDVDAILQGQGTSLTGILVLYAIAIGCYGASIAIFQRRNLPL